MLSNRFVLIQTHAMGARRDISCRVQQVFFADLIKMYWSAMSFASKFYLGFSLIPESVSQGFAGVVLTS
jgi:hypothetical protein